ncbi:uncharacterized protein AB675_6336 [Cyphellophora attinorum]|uniref:Acriflavine sensitivity control protein acr-2 n=1 Tax=Cyphellophora attinorum TaxID=1664694 RepID=A0A0N1HF88_9EURO|nr:uncharacterized protein AB675_6336 [Phialophora attinorum]KPI43790.1 hypothetical protein AB675_6336 [Phialophora attinorum]
MPRGRPTQWQLVVPWLHSRQLVTLPAVNRRLLQYWVENVSQIMTLNPENNPMSFPIVQQLDDSEALVHALQSVSAGHECFYDLSALSTSLEERGKALCTIRKEIQSTTAIRLQSFLAVWMLGFSSQWINNDIHDFGQEHLMAARSILEGLLLQRDFGPDHPFRPLVIGAYLWWDMACSFLVHSSEQTAIDTAQVCAAVTSVRGKFCALVSHATELFYYLCCLGRYCRALVDTGSKNQAFEDYIEQELLMWDNRADGKTLHLLNEAFRLHGIIMLRRICQSVDNDNERYIRSCVIALLDNISKIGTKDPVFKFTTIPLVSAGAELTSQDQQLRTRVTEWNAVIYSYNRLLTNTRVTTLLLDLWSRKDAGQPTDWLRLMLENGWLLMLG